MTCGLTQGGVSVIAGIDNDPACQKTYEANNPGSKFILADVFDLKEADLAKTLKLKRNDDSLVLIGCSPCQFWSIIRTDKTKSMKSKNLLIEFKRFVDYFNPGYVLVENVPGILAKKDSSGLGSFVSSLEKKGYKVHFDIVNMSEYGVPQSRRRFSLLATRVHDKPIFPEKINKRLSVQDVLGEENGFDKIEWTTGQQQFDRYAHGTEEEKAKRLRGMQEFYDKILPNTFNAEFNKNKWGNAKVATTKIIGKYSQDNYQVLLQF